MSSLGKEKFIIVNSWTVLPKQWVTEHFKWNFLNFGGKKKTIILPADFLENLDDWTFLTFLKTNHDKRRYHMNHHLSGPPKLWPFQAVIYWPQPIGRCPKWHNSNFCFISLSILLLQEDYSESDALEEQRAGGESGISCGFMCTVTGKFPWEKTTITEKLKCC